MLSGHGGIGRRVRLRGVWLHRPSSSLGDRTTKKISTNFVRVFSFSADTELELPLQIEQFAGNNACIVGTGTVRCTRLTFGNNRCWASLGRPQAKRDASAQHLRKSSTVDIASKCNTKCCVRTHAGAIAPFAKRRPHQQREKRTKRFVFFLCVRVIETCVQLVARRIYAQLGLRPTDCEQRIRQARIIFICRAMQT